METSVFLAADVLRITGITERMLSQSIALGLIEPSGGASPGKGVDRLFDFGDLFALAALRHLRDLGYPRPLAVPLIKHLKASTGGRPKQRWCVLYADGTFVTCSAKALVNALMRRGDRAMVGALILSLTQVYDSVVGGISECTIVRSARRGRKPGTPLKELTRGARRLASR